MIRARHVAALAGLLVAVPAVAQTPGDLVSRGIRAYEALDFNAAAGLLTIALGAGEAAALSRDELVRALTHLGAAEVFRGNQATAVAAFERLVVADPRYRIDELVFPPEVTDLFNAVRRRTPAVLVRPEAAAVELETFRAWLYPSVFHEVTVELQRGDGRAVRRLYRGLIGDSLAVEWYGRDSTGASVASGAYLLVVRSFDTQNWAVRYAQVPLEVEVRGVDTLPHPQTLDDSDLLPERIGESGGIEALLGAAVAGAAVSLLPQVLAPRAELSPARFVVGGSVGLAGILGFALRRPRELPENVRINQERRRAWREQVASVTAANQRRRAEIRLVVRAGEQVMIDLRGR